MVGISNIVSVGGSAGGGSVGAVSGIQFLNGQSGPSVILVGTSGIEISPVFPNVINIGFTGDLAQSGVLGVNGIDVQQIGGNFVVDGASLSGLIPEPSLASGCYTESFNAITSGNFVHNLGTQNLLVQVIDNHSPPRQIFTDGISYDTLDSISVLFNRPQSGKVIVIACGSVGGTTTSQRAELDMEFKEAFNGDTYAEITRVSGQLSQIDIWETSVKTNKLFTKTLARVSGQLSQVVLIDEQTSSTLITDLGRDVSGVLTTVTKTYTV